MVTWQQIGQGEPNPFDVTYTNNSTYSASYGEFVITEGSQVDLPAPSENSAVAVRSFEQEVTITTPSGNIWDSTTTGKVNFNSPRYVILVSDGTNWYVQNNESGIGLAIPDTEIDHFEWGGPVTDRYDELKDKAGVIDTNSPVVEGSYSLKHDDSDYPDLVIVSYPGASYPDGGLPNYPQPGDRIAGFVYTRVEQSLSRPAVPQILLAAVQGELSFYNVKFSARNDVLEISKTITNSLTILNDTTQSIQSNEWYYLQIDYNYDSSANETTIELTAFETDANNEPLFDNPLNSVSATDGTSRLQDNGDGGFGFQDISTYISVWDDWNLARGGADF